MGKQDAKYIHNLARTITGQIKLNFLDFDPYGPNLGENILTKFGWVLERKITALSPETLGKIASLGLSQGERASWNGLTPCTMQEVHKDNPNWLGASSSSGKDLLVKIVAATIVAAIIDNMRLFYVQASVNGTHGVKIGRYVDDTPLIDNISPPAAHVTRPSLDDYDARRDRFPDGELAHYEGSFGIYYPD